MAQTLEQRRRNAKFAREQEARMGKPESAIKKKEKKVVLKSPVSPFWLIILAFVVFGGLFFEVLASWFH
ncbi:hypothetical protein VHEMI10034 [[Torrubiella] hemipterigena]|uniref:Stress-associated endoplasmic reticulum protein n=1 Tax=[Torrubiella] hemipterigena TaxID=1531966 RepID=A0A0A1TR53_9HYPO|nr:hypothetical protein VHEMI10034 [[Torrubiella] hemipterigena]